MKVRFFHYLFALGLLLFSSCSFFNQDPDEDLKTPVDYVNPYIGNLSYWSAPTYPTIHLPNSMLRVWPQQKGFTGGRLDGLPLMMIRHRGGSAFYLSPFQGDEGKIKPVVSSGYTQEELTPYSYSVYLEEQQIQVDYGLSHQSAIYKIEFENKQQPAYLIFNSKEGEFNWDGMTLSGHLVLKNDTKVFLFLVPEILPQSVRVLKDHQLVENLNAKGRDACLVLKYPGGTEALELKYGISFISEEQARKNLRRELAKKNIEQLHDEGRKYWNNVLGKIEVNGATYDEKVVFYTSLYRCYERPVCISEDGRYYSPFDHQVHDDRGAPFYTDDLIGETYRATHPLRVILEPELQTDIIKSYLRMADQMDHFRLPAFPMITGDCRQMSSNHGIAPIIDSYRKGLTGFDLEKAYRAGRNAINGKTHTSLIESSAGESDQFNIEHENAHQVGTISGATYEEWCLAQMASELGKEKDYVYFSSRSNDSTFSGGEGAREYFGESNRWKVQHNISDLVKLMQGPENFMANLDSAFEVPLRAGLNPDFFDRLQDDTSDVSQFALGNGSSLHIPYLYNYCGAPWKTQKHIRKLLNLWFRNDLMGVPGYEIGGDMSAFVVFSQLGFYPVTPGLPVYNIGSPAFEKASIELSSGSVFKIIAENYDPENMYVQSVKLNGQKLTEPWFLHSDISDGGELVLEMGKFPNKKWGADLDAAPPSFSMEEY